MEDNPLVLFGLRLKELRKIRGISQEKLALECGIARSYLGEVERGKRNIALINIYKLADTLGVPASTLLEPPSQQIKED
ncbi:helix-turn-helix transcriptional regulator [Acinetobacter puyangensis]|uniref:DNA-binding transcriptional regulator, XRE-family HTH domain n=1 Tax=Acinetobacter puyangensis TaxID=1096779 RepID=A0A240E636_9GAMM|nr:helix-turn-helix transcriptional regulator [Acinetobacter puyangensis]SNX43679.1 DNA-binding transcriptional regulator, XRE-family HTH domain [Acinetobacter puyangensis]